MITRVVAGVGVDVDGMFVGVGACVGVAGAGVPVGDGVGVAGVPVGVAPVVTCVETGVGTSMVAVGAGGGVPGGCPGGGPISSSHSIPAWAISVTSPSWAAVITPAICPGPPKAAKRHCIPTRSSGPIPTCGAEVSHSSSFRHAIVTNSPVMPPAMALAGSPSMSAVMTAFGSMTSNAARTQSEVSWLNGPGPGTNPARKILARVSSLRHPMSLACSSRDVGLCPVSDRFRVSGSSPMHASSALERADCRDSES